MMSCINSPEMAEDGPTGQTGQIQVIFGPMFSGKTTELMRRLKRYQLANYKCLVIKYAKDIRYDDCGIATHDKQVLSAVGTTKLLSLLSQAMEADVIGVDEGQFFPDTVEFCELMADKGKTVVVAALDGTFQRRGFGDILKLVPIAESVVKLSAVCMQCYGTASFTKRKGTETEVEVIGGAEMYLATCRACHKEPGMVSPVCSPQLKQSWASNPAVQDVKATASKRLFGAELTNNMDTH